MPTQLASKVSETYQETFRQFVQDEDRMRQEWNSTVEELVQVDPTNPSELVSCHALVQTLEAILFPAAAIGGKQIEY